MRAYTQSGQYDTIVGSRFLTRKKKKKTQSKAMRGYTQSGQYDTIVGSRFLTKKTPTSPN